MARDSSVKRYSSGMHVRLAFSVAAHLEPEILIGDEVHAVGDSEFQKKCVGPMQDVAANEGRTVLFVSHNLGSVRALCTRAVLLEKGQIQRVGTAEEVLEAYVGLGQLHSKTSLADRKDSISSGRARLPHVFFTGPSGRPVQSDGSASGACRCSISAPLSCVRPARGRVKPKCRTASRR